MPARNLHKLRAEAEHRTFERRFVGAGRLSRTRPAWRALNRAERAHARRALAQGEQP